MSMSYKKLLALADAHTTIVERRVQSLRAQKERNERLRRLRQDHEEHKQRQLEHDLRIQHFERQKKETDAHAKETEERKALQICLEEREAERREACRYRPRKTKIRRAAVSRARTLPRKCLTRKEKRAHRQHPGSNGECEELVQFSQHGTSTAAPTRATIIEVRNSDAL
ncbi:hypothetical protein R3P38DRAFT_2788125 [Favolaschia claudopus]|uniref:Uncharacterized protein n=1 Tax=Favolaschia claudopus TaxID=2862362 RepID=A0AAW0AP59_9AGAR